MKKSNILKSVELDYEIKKLREADEQQEEQQANDASQEGGDSSDGNAEESENQEEDSAPEGYETTEQQTPANAQAAITNSSTGTLVLDDGTDTGISQDDAGQTQSLDDTQNKATISFEKGNYNQIVNLPNNINKKITELSKTFVPLCEKALIELFNNSASFRSVSFNATPTTQDNGTIKIDAEIKYHADAYIGVDIPQEDVQWDTQYIIQTISVLKSANVRNVSINTETGDIDISVTL